MFMSLVSVLGNDTSLGSACDRIRQPREKMMAMTRLHEVPGLCSAIDHRFGVRVVACILSRCLELHAVL